MVAARSDGHAFGVGGMSFAPDGRLFVSTREGQVWTYADGAWTLFADGLHEPLGVYVDPRTSQVFCVQRPELTELIDGDGDGRAERFRTVCAGWGLTDNYHEYAYGLVRDAEGNFYGTLNTSLSWPGWAGSDKWDVARVHDCKMGRAAEYRRSSLQKYRDFVKESRDFPLAEFRSRHDAATEAVGYGKVLMGFHALRLQLGDETFQRFLVVLYRRYQGKRASFADLQAVAEEVSERDLGRFFEEWVQRPGAPKLELDRTRVRSRGGEWTLTGRLRQTQDAEPWLVEVPLVVQLASGAERHLVVSSERSTKFTIELGERPLAVHADPLFGCDHEIAQLVHLTGIEHLFHEGEPVDAQLGDFLLEAVHGDSGRRPVGISHTGMTGRQDTGPSRSVG